LGFVGWVWFLGVWGGGGGRLVIAGKGWLVVAGGVLYLYIYIDINSLFQYLVI